MTEMIEKEDVMIKVLIVKDDVQEIQDYLNNGWNLASGWNHPNGCLTILTKLDRASTVKKWKDKNVTK